MPERQNQSDEVAALKEEIVQLRRAVVSHAVVDQAIGVVVACGRVGPDTAWEILKDVSQRTNTKLREVAEHVVRWPARAWLPPDIHHALRTVLRRHRVLEPGGAPVPGDEPSAPAVVRSAAQLRRVRDGLVP